MRGPRKRAAAEWVAWSIPWALLRPAVSTARCAGKDARRTSEGRAWGADRVEQVRRSRQQESSAERGGCAAGRKRANRRRGDGRGGGTRS